MAATVEDATQSMIANLKEKTGKSLDQWVKIAKDSKLTKHGEIVKHLKEEHGLTHGYANLVVHTALQSSAGAAENTADLVEVQYSGAKAGLRPTYDALLKKIHAFGKDVDVAPKKAYVSIRRSKQFALIQPSTATRLDIGIQLKGEKPTARLEASGSFNAMVSHRVRVEKAGDVDAELIGWLKRAYEGA